MKKLLLIAFLLLATLLQAQVRIDEKEAFSTAKRFLQDNTKTQNTALTLCEAINSKQSGQVNLYVFSVEPKGFVIVSALNDVLAYSPTSSMLTSELLPSHITYWLNLYNETTDYLIEHPEQKEEPMRSQTSVEPLLTSCWGQGCYHNEACPVDNTGPCQHVEAGCVAVAMAQIMYYHKSPSKGNGTLTYPCPPYGYLSADFGNTYYQWDSMADTLHESNPAVATLVFHCGVSVKTRYSSNGSGAYSQSVPDALQNYFYYPASSLAKRFIYDDEQWQKIIRNDLDQQRPVYYSGTSNLGGHAFVCDGYDDNGKFHFNFGWDGVADGYYTLNSPYGFSENQTIVHNIFPIDNIPIHSDSHGIIYVAPDGIGDGSSWAQATSELQLAILKSTMDSSKIWVKGGIYTGNPEEEFAFTPLFGCKLYGGFNGDEPYDYNLSQRDFGAHPSILDGSQTQGVIGELSNNNDTIIIDGFTIQNGNAEHGGGILLQSNTQIRNCKFCHNHAQSYGGAISHYYLTKPRTILVEDCEFFANEATFGGAIADYGNASFIRCVFHDNYAINDGGGIYGINKGAHSCFFNCTFSNNTARQGGGIAIFENRGPTIWNCLINNNTAETGGGCYLTNTTDLYNCTIVKNEGTASYGGVYCSSPADIRNCIIWGNTCPGEDIQIGPLQTYSYCAVQDLLTEKTDNNFSTASENDGDSTAFYVRFKDPEVIAGNTGHGGDWRLQPNSFCIDGGDNIASQPEFDLDGNPRLRHKSLDLGAYESNTIAHFIETVFCEYNPYYYQDSLITNIGYYSFFYPGDPYDSLVILYMTNPPATIYHAEEICENETFDFFGTQLNAAGVYYKTVDCITHELALSIKPLNSVNMHKVICEDETLEFHGTLLNETGTYYDTVDCIAYKLDLIVDPWVDHHMEESICEGETYNFFGRVLHDGGQYLKTIGCDSYELDLTINQPPTIHCCNDTIVELGHPAFLFASGADSYLWSTGDTTDRIIVYPKEDMLYSVTGFLNGCGSMARVKVKIDPSIGSHSGDETIIFPNPANDKVEIYAPFIDEVEVLNLFGVSIERIKTNREAVTLDVSHYTNGVYIIHVRQLNNHSYNKLIIQH